MKVESLRKNTQVKNTQELKNQEITEDTELALGLERCYIKYKEKEGNWDLRKKMQEEAGDLIFFTLSLKKKEKKKD